MRKLALAIALLAAVGGVASAQMPPPGMMPDPSQMSGIPRPEGPSGTLSVRVLRGDFAHPMIGVTVELVGSDGAKQVQKVDATDHATFTGLSGGPWTVRCTDAGVTKESQPIEMQDGIGTKVMLVFPKDDKADLGMADGRARVDGKLPAGTVVVKVVDDDDKPLSGVEVVLAHTGDDKKIVEARAATAADGTARWDGLDGKPAYAAKELRKDAEAATEPFKLDGKAGMLVALRASEVSHDLKALHINKKSHFIVEIRDEGVQVLENLVVENTATAPVDPGPRGLRLPLADGAQGAELEPDSAPGVKLDGNEVVWPGHIPTGEAEIHVAFILPLDGGAVTLRQPTPVAYDRLLAVTDYFPGMTVTDASGAPDSYATSVVESPQKRSFWRIDGPPLAAGGTLVMRFAGLPTQSTTGRFAATAIAALIALWGLLAAIRARRGGDSAARADAEARRRSLLDKLVAVDEKRAVKSTAKLDAEREKLMAELESIYRDLEAHGDAQGGAAER